MTDKISDAVHVMAEAARGDPRISLGDLIDQWQAETALVNWAQAISFDRDGAQQALLQAYPHLKATYFP